MVKDVTAKMWGIFDETGIFLCLYRHGFVLMIVDMIKSGEFLIEHLGNNIGNGYDVGCDFQTTIKNSPLAARARQCNFRCLVGTFHGHAHNRLCQLCNLATYVLGLGCEDLEGCERFFSGSNGLAKSCRDASRFHRQQEITSYIKHYDSFHTYANLSKFVTNNYKQAVNILKKEEALRTWMREEGILDYSVFCVWLEEEKTFLLGLKEGSKDQTETLEMDKNIWWWLLKPGKPKPVMLLIRLGYLKQNWRDVMPERRAEVQSQPWTRPAYRLAMDTYFKIERAQEEIIRLNIEIRRMMTWMRDEGIFFRNLGDIGDVVEMEDSNTEEEEELTRPDDSDDKGIEAHEETLSGLLYQVSMVSIDDRTEPLGDDE
ncbi:hypothetical protein B0H14DRAFT_2626005 [Mycena olivaceomarginata]|nr:hypothetical protein B0H14DRAFT_2626005 [Mycena olivaceomarginata]